MTFWDLPGTIRYVEEVLQALRLGSNIVVRFPASVPTTLRDKVFSAFRGGGFRSTSLRCGHGPMETLCERFLGGGSSAQDGLRLLFECDDFSERLIWLEGMNPDNWAAWHSFLVQHSHASRALAVHRRTLFIMPLSGAPPEIPTNHDAVRVFDWDDVIDEMDILFFASDRLRRKGMERSLVTLLAMAISRLAIWDFETAERLVEGRPEEILQPVPLLREMAREKGWDKNTAIRWSLGTASKSGTAHVARLGVEEPAREVERRVWSAQASVLLPEIDTQRYEIIRENIFDVRGWLNRHEKNQDPFDLEIGDLYKVLQRIHANRLVRKRVADLRSARNRLAHIQALPPHHALRVAGISDY